MIERDLIVLGAGPAGVGAAYRAAARGLRVTVLERADRVGGAAGSIEVAGIRCDLGSHRLHPSTDPAILAELRRLLGEDLQERARNGRVRIAGRWIAFPLRPLDLALRLPPGFAFAAARDALTRSRRSASGDTFASALVAGLGPTICDRFYFPYARKLWGLEPEEISAEQARRRVSADSAAKLVRRVARGARASGRTFFYPRRGYGQLWEALAVAAQERGADIRLGANVATLETGPRSVVVRDADGRAYEAKRVWSTIPLTALARMLDPPAPADVLDAGARLRFRAMLLVYLVLDTDRYTPYDAHYIPDPSTPVTRLSEPKNYRDGDDPAGRTVLCAEVPCSLDDSVWRASDDELGALVADGLRRIGLPAPRPVAVETRRLPQAYPVYDRGYEDALARVAAWLDGVPRVLTFGRQGSFAYTNAHHALQMAWAAADAIRPDDGFDDEAWRGSRAAFASFVVED